MLRYCAWTADMFSFFTSCSPFPSPRRLPSPCMTPEDDMWSSITWLTVWATCLRRMSTHVSLLYNYCTITYAYIWTITAMSAHARAYGSRLSWTIDDNCLSPNGSNSNRCHEHSHHSAITVLSFSYLSFSLSRPTLWLSQLEHLRTASARTHVDAPKAVYNLYQLVP